MRLWHEQMIDSLPKNQLLGQHRECCALRGNYDNLEEKRIERPIYKEHNAEYPMEYIENLQKKDIKSEL